MSRLKKTAKPSSYETRTYTFEGRPEILDQFEKAIDFISFCGNVGASREVSIFIDGDGRAQIIITRIDDKGKKIKMNEVENPSDLTSSGENPIKFGVE